MSDPYLALIPGLEPKRVKGHRETVAEHLTELRNEFIGRPEICYMLACQIVKLRRSVDPDADWSYFLKLHRDYEDTLVRNMNLRWLVSICDTYADFGNPTEKNAAIAISSFINLIKLTETERLHTTDPALRLPFQSPKPLWDGMMSYNIPKGDMPRNLFARLNKALINTPHLQNIWAEAFDRLKKNDNILSRLAIHNPGFYTLS